MWEEYKEPFATVEFPTEADYKAFEEMVDFWRKHHNEEGNEI